MSYEVFFIVIIISIITTIIIGFFPLLLLVLILLFSVKDIGSGPFIVPPDPTAGFLFPPPRLRRSARPGPGQEPRSRAGRDVRIFALSLAFFQWRVSYCQRIDRQTSLK